MVNYVHVLTHLGFAALTAAVCVPVVLIAMAVASEAAACSVANGDYVFECHNAANETFESNKLCFDFELVQDHIRTFNGCLHAATTAELERYFAPNSTWPCYSNAPLNKLCDVAIARRSCGTGALIFCLVAVVLCLGFAIVAWVLIAARLHKWQYKTIA